MGWNIKITCADLWKWAETKGSHEKSQVTDRPRDDLGPSLHTDIAATNDGTRYNLVYNSLSKEGAQLAHTNCQAMVISCKTCTKKL